MSLLTTIESMPGDAAAWLEAEAEAVATEAWIKVIQPLLETVAPEILADLSTLIDTEIGQLIAAGVDLATGLPVGTLLTNLLNTAESEGKTAIASLAAPVLTAVVALKTIGVSAVATTATAAVTAVADAASAPAS